MKKCSALLLSLLVAVAWTALPLLATAADEKGTPSANVVGAKKCKICHSSAKLGGTGYKIWAKAKHADAFKTLSSDKAKEAAKKLGVADPTTDDRCLKCHTLTGKKLTAEQTKDKITLEEGVSCERCHGAAEKYLKPHGKAKAEERASKEEVTKMGRKDMTKKEDREKLCQECHKSDPDSPFFKEFKYDEAWKKIDHSKKAQAAAADKK